MPNRHKSRTLFLALAAMTACAPGGAPAPTAAPTGPLPGDNYAFVYAEAGWIRYLDTRSGVVRTLARGAPEAAEPTSTGSRVAVAYSTDDSSHVTAIDLDRGDVLPVHTSAPNTTHTLGWSMDESRLGVGFRGDAASGVAVLDADGAVRSMGCRASSHFMVWRSATQAIVHGGTNHYTVNTSNCATLATLQRAGKRNLGYAANGRRAMWFQDRSVTFQSRSQPELIPELWIADYDGRAARVIADYQSRPRHAVYSPGARKIAYEVVSRRWANTTHIVTYDIASHEYTFVAEEKLLGVPSDFNVCWSPDGRRIAHDRTYARSGVQVYTTRQVVVRDGTDELEVFDEVINQPATQVVANRPATCRWVGNKHLLVSSRRGQRVIDVADGETYDVPADRLVLGVMAFDRER